jgi:sortase A
LETQEKANQASQAPRLGRIAFRAERTALVFGVAALAFWGAANLAGMAGAREDLERFAAIRVASSQQPAPLAQTPTPDMRLWDLERVPAWRTTFAEPAHPPLGILRIPKIRLEVAVLPGSDDFVLNRAVGHIEGTALPGTDSNSGIAGHRDGFFRGLKDLTIGDAIELETLEGREMYRVERTWIVDPEEVSVLEPTPIPALTLVTCYPFYVVGSAPQRFIVRAVLEETRMPLARH